MIGKKIHNQPPTVKPSCHPDPPAGGEGSPNIGQCFLVRFFDRYSLRSRRYFGVAGLRRTNFKVLQYLQFAFFLLATPFFTAQAQQAQTPFEQLKQKFESGQIFKADFTHRYEDSYTQEVAENSGKIWVGKEQYKVDSPTQLIAVNGEISKVYDSKRNRIIVSTYEPEEDDFAPSRILNGIDSTYTIDQQEKQGNRHIITLSSDDPFALFQMVRITLNDALIPLEIFVKDPADNLITTTFSGGSFMDGPKNLFEINYPANAEIIDMRN